MDTKKIGMFLKELRKEKGLSQEQLSEILLVSGRTISRWETGTNMPDLSILLQMSEFYDVELKEILDGERKGEIMDKELKETLSKVADYNKLEKKKVEKAGNIAFILTFLVCVVTIIIQLIVTVKLSIVIGETVILLVGGIAYIVIMIYNGVWESGACSKNNSFKNFLISVVCSGIFTVALTICYIRLGAKTSQIVYVSILFFAGIAIVGFLVLRILAYYNGKRKNRNIKELEKTKEIQPVSVVIAKGNMQANMIVEALKKNNIMAYKQDLGDAGFASVRYGMGKGIDDRIAIFVASEKADDATTVIKEMGLS